MIATAKMDYKIRFNDDYLELAITDAAAHELKRERFRFKQAI